MLLHAFWRTAWTWAFLACICSTGSGLYAQDDNGDDDDEEELLAGMAGVSIDATGVLRVMQVDPRIANAQRLATLQSTPQGQLKTSPMRKVSLNRLESYVAKELAAGRDLSSEVWSLAGLQRLEYVLYLPESQDIVIAGPADQWYADKAGRLVGLTNGRATLRLDDMVVALRAFSPDSGATKSIGCSIDPTPEGLKRMSMFHAQQQGQMPADVRPYVAGMKNALGMQVVSIRGVPATTHFARVLVEADYRMKLIGIGLLDPMIPLKSWAERSQSTGSSNALQRWYFEADYSTVATNEAGTVMHLAGRGVKLSGELEGVQGATGTRRKTGRAGDAASVAFTRDFTNKFDELADVTPVFHEMRNLFDMSIAAAFIQDRNLYEKANWKLGTFASEEGFSVNNGTEVSQVETAINAFMRDNQLVTPIGGGVHIAARSLVNPSKVSVSPNVDKESQSMGAPADLRKDQWWWD